MSEMDPKAITLKFIDRINSGDPDGLMALQTDDFTFTSYSEEVYVGKDGWHDYFSSYPKYKIHVEKLITSGNGVAVIGHTTGCHVGPKIEEKWTILWTAQVRNGLIAEWRIYSDIEEIRAEIASGGQKS
jgi:ketosteroid isomerase-like protein